MNSETEQKSALHKQKWEKDVGYEYTLKDCENLVPTSPKALVNTTHRLIYDLYIQYMTCVLYTTEVTPDQTHDFTQTVGIPSTGFGGAHPSSVFGTIFINICQKYPY